MASNRFWYAVTSIWTDGDWGHGTFNPGEIEKMVNDTESDCVVVVAECEGNHHTAIQELHKEGIYWTLYEGDSHLGCGNLEDMIECLAGYEEQMV